MVKFKDNSDEAPLINQSNERLRDEKISFSQASLNKSKNNPDDIDNEDDEDDVYEKPFKTNDITLWLSDAIVLVIDHLQYYALILSLSEHWGWPTGWIEATAFSFLFNFDIWEFRKVETEAFDHSRSSFISTDEIGFNYASYLGAWAVILCIIGGCFAGIYIQWMRKRPLHLLLYRARWKRIMFLVLQFLTIPFGVAAARIFHCRLDESTGKDVMAVQNEYECFSSTHYAFIVLVSIIFFCWFIIYPLILYCWIKDQVFSNNPVRHEGYLQLKEAEYEQGLDILWDIGQYHLFSSYKRFWSYYNPLKFIFKLFVIIAFASNLHSNFYASAGVVLCFLVGAVVLIFKRPYRVGCFNVVIIISHFIIAANALIGNFMVKPPWADHESFFLVSFLRQPTITHILSLLNGAWVVVLVLWVLYLILLNKGLLGKERIWPRLSYDSSNFIGEDTKKYLKAALKARLTLEYSLRTLPLFAPVHELSHQVKVINAYCREAEYIGDPTHDTLWDLLDELIEAHNSLATVSVFGMSGKNSVRETSEEFIRLMPSFKKRLRQREYDFILMTPLKRRLLLKMYILSVFVNSKRKEASPEEEASTKLQQALLEFDSRSLSTFDDSSSRSASTLSPGNSRMLSWSDRPISSPRPESSEITSRADSDMAGFINDVENFASLYPIPENQSKGRRVSQNSTRSSGRKISEPVKSSVSDKQRNLSAPLSQQVEKSSSSRQKKISAPPQMRTAKQSTQQSTNRPGSSTSSSSSSSNRRNSSSLSPIPQENTSYTFDMTELNRTSPTTSKQSSDSTQLQKDRPGTAPLSPRVLTQSPSNKERPGTAPLSPSFYSQTPSNNGRTETDSSSPSSRLTMHQNDRPETAPLSPRPYTQTSLNQGRPGTAPLSPSFHSSTQLQNNRPGTSPVQRINTPSRPSSGRMLPFVNDETKFSDEFPLRSRSPERPGSRNSTPLQEISSTLSLPGQIEEEETRNVKHSTTEL